MIYKDDLIDGLLEVLNKNDLDAFKAFARKNVFINGIEPSNEEVWNITWRKVQYNRTDCYPKVRKEAKKWLLEHGYSLEVKIR